MKRFLKQLILAGAAVLALAGCDKDKNLDHTKVSEVGNIFTPEDNLFVKLQPTTSASVVFEWEQARAEDGGLVMYEVAFAKADGDFSKPVFKTVSDNGGVFNKATISHKTLNTIAALAGIEALESGSLKWTVISSKGINAVTSAVIRTIELERPAGFSELPADLYITGDATEGGADLASGLQLKQTSNGIFEMYTSLKAGSWHLASGKTGTPTLYGIEGTAIKEGATATVAGDTKIYRLVFDFNNAAFTQTEVKEIALWFSPDNETKFTLPYIGNGQFKAENVSVPFKQESWGRDERYKFRMQVNDGTEDSYEWLGSSNGDNSRPTEGSAASYWYLFPVVNNDQWNYAYKFQTEADTVPLDITVDFSTSDAYTHKVEIR